MLDRKLVTRNPDRVRETLQRRHVSDDMHGALRQLEAIMTRRRELQGETDELRAQRNSLSKQVGALMKSGHRDEAGPLRDQVKDVSARLDIQEAERKELEGREDQALMMLPNMLDERVPTGKSDADNPMVATWGEPPVMDFEPQDHVTIGERLGILDFGRAAKLSGARFPVYVGTGAALERALISWFLDMATREHGYTEVLVPYIVSKTSMTGTGQLPKFEEDLFKLAAPLNGEDAYLIPTAEVPVTNLHRDEILDQAQLPLSYTAFTPCFRAEAGSYGKDVRGLMRQHQFHKVEMVKICTPEQGQAAHEELTGHAEALLQGLGLPYRKVLLCSGDTGFSAAITYDLEVWVPSQDTYREISSCSWFTDFQSRRLKMRYRTPGKKGTTLCHTVNGSGLAVGRTVIAVIENYQQADGSVIIPEVLRPYLGGLARIDAPV